jgi:Uncharacterised nucleotidyltransferase
VVKGFSLVPEFCPEIALRPLGDLDYLVDCESLAAAREAILQRGYSAGNTSPTEWGFLSPGSEQCHKVEDQYSRQAPYCVELHLSLWNPNVHGVALAVPAFSVKKIRTRIVRDHSFRALPWEDTFLLQVIHSFQHILCGWMGVSWIYEIGRVC